MGKVGRPRGGFKHHTTVYLSVEAISLLEKNRVNKSQFFDQVAIMTYSDPDRLKLSELRERKAKLDVETASVEAQISLLEARIAESRRIREEADAERLVDAWYFRKLVKEGRAHGKSGLANGYYLRVDYDAYMSDARKGLVSESSPVEQFLPYAPKIFDEKTRRIAKIEMLAEIRMQEAGE